MFLENERMYNRFVRLVGKLYLSEVELSYAEVFLDKHQNLDATMLMNIARTQRVIPQVYHNLQSLKERISGGSFFDEFLAKAQRYLEIRKKNIDVLLAELELYAVHAEAAGVHFMVIKGACFQNLYPIESFRLFKDIDLVISKDTAWKGIDVFKQIRYRTDRIRLEGGSHSELASTEISENTLGIAQMVDLEGHRGSFDLHLGAFPGCGDSILEADVWERAIPLQIGSQEVLIPSLEDCILIICAHISRHGYAPLKELNDIYAGLRHTGNNLNWDYLCQSARKNTLQSILYGILSRLKRDYDIELTEEIRRILKPDPCERLVSKLVFRPGKLNLNFHGARQLFLGRFLQGFVLYRYYRDRVRFLTAIKEMLSGIYFLFQNGRPYRLWKTREIQSFQATRRIVIVPIKAATKKTYWHIKRIHLQEAEQFALKAGISVEWISKAIVVWNVGHPNELILTPEGVYTQSAYNGDIDEGVLERIQQVAWDVTTQLNETGAIHAKRDEVCRGSGKVS